MTIHTAKKTSALRPFTTITSHSSSSPFFNLAGLANARETTHLSRERRLPRTEFAPHLQLLRASEVDPFAPAPGASASAVQAAVAATKRAEDEERTGVKAQTVQGGSTGRDNTAGGEMEMEIPVRTRTGEEIRVSGTAGGRDRVEQLAAEVQALQSALADVSAALADLSATRTPERTGGRLGVVLLAMMTALGTSLVAVAAAGELHLFPEHIVGARRPGQGYSSSAGVQTGSSSADFYGDERKQVAQVNTAHKADGLQTSLMEPMSLELGSGKVVEMGNLERKDEMRGQGQGAAAPLMSWVGRLFWAE